MFLQCFSHSKSWMWCPRSLDLFLPGRLKETTVFWPVILCCQMEKRMSDSPELWPTELEQWHWKKPIPVAKKTNPALVFDGKPQCWFDVSLPWYEGSKSWCPEQRWAPSLQNKIQLQCRNYLFSICTTYWAFHYHWDRIKLLSQQLSGLKSTRKTSFTLQIIDIEIYLSSHEK